MCVTVIVHTHTHTHTHFLSLSLSLSRSLPSVFFSRTLPARSCVSPTLDQVPKAIHTPVAESDVAFFARKARQHVRDRDAPPLVKGVTANEPPVNPSVEGAAPGSTSSSRGAGEGPPVSTPALASDGDTRSPAPLAESAGASNNTPIDSVAKTATPAASTSRGHAAVSSTASSGGDGASVSPPVMRVHELRHGIYQQGKQLPLDIYVKDIIEV